MLVSINFFFLNSLYRLVQSVPELLGNEEIVSRVVAALLKSEHYQHAGQLYEAIHRVDKALECYRRGHVYPKAVELARFVSPKGNHQFLYLHELLC